LQEVDWLQLTPPPLLPELPVLLPLLVLEPELLPVETAPSFGPDPELEPLVLPPAAPSPAPDVPPVPELPVPVPELPAPEVPLLAPAPPSTFTQ
jgi:hypothetical protein